MSTAISRELRALAVVAAVSAGIVGVVAATRSSGESTAAADSLPGAAPATSTTTTATATATVTGSAPATTIKVSATGAPTTVAFDEDSDLDERAAGDTGGTGDGCTLEVASIRQGASGDNVLCLQHALKKAGLYTASPSGTFDEATAQAVRRVQTERKMFVDGIVGRETAISLGIWPDEASLVVRTPPPPAGAKDLLGFKLSPVATSGPDAPPLPESSGSGKRLVYSRAGQRVWAVDANERVIRSWLVTGSKYSNEMPGTHKVYSKSERSTAWNGQAYLPLMVRYYKTKIGAIGFHGIPTHVSDGTPYQTDAELGTRLSGGCQRQNNLDATFVWHFAEVGTTVVVV